MLIIYTHPRHLFELPQHIHRGPLLCYIYILIARYSEYSKPRDFV